MRPLDREHVPGRSALPRIGPEKAEPGIPGSASVFSAIRLDELDALRIDRRKVRVESATVRPATAPAHAPAEPGTKGRAPTAEALVRTALAPMLPAESAAIRSAPFGAPALEATTFRTASSVATARAPGDMSAGSAMSAARTAPPAELLRGVHPAHTLGQEGERKLVQAHALSLGQLGELPVHRAGQPQHELAAVVVVPFGFCRGNRVLGRTLLDRDAHGIADLIERTYRGRALGKIGRAEQIAAVLFYEKGEAVRAVGAERTPAAHPAPATATWAILEGVLSLSADRFDGLDLLDRLGVIAVVDVI